MAELEGTIVGFMLGLALLTAPAFASDAKLNKAKRTYKQFCAHCHGLNMVNPGTSSYDLRKWPKDQKDRFFTVVKKGKGNMPAWGDILTPDELEHLWYYVATRAGTRVSSRGASLQSRPSVTIPSMRRTTPKPH